MMHLELHWSLVWINRLGCALGFGWLVWSYWKTIKSKPRFDASDILFQEWFASGCSQKNFITKIGGARNCLRLVVTKDFLWVTSWFPFSLFAAYYDLEHLIPLSSITSARHERFLGGSTLLISFPTRSGESRTLRLIPAKMDIFEQAIAGRISRQEPA